jgi:hypothetical protein
VSEAEERREARRASTPGAALQARDERRFAAQARAEADAFLVPVDDATHDVVVDVEGAGAGAEPPPRRIRPEEYSLCELLVHHVEDPPLVRLVDEYVPLALLQHPHAKLVAGAVFDTIRTGRDELLALQETAAPDVLEFVRRIAVAPVRSDLGDFTQKEVAHDLILAIWRNWFQRQRDAVAGSGGDPVEGERRRARIALDLRALREWSTGTHVIGRARAQLLEGASAPPAATAAHDAPGPAYAAPAPGTPRPPARSAPPSPVASGDAPPLDEPLESVDELPEW